jgi:hypothetical protein
MTLQNLTIIICVLLLAASAAADNPIQVGLGQNTADLYIEFSDGFITQFAVSFDTSTITGLEMFDIVEAETTLATDRQDYGWGVFINGIDYLGHSDLGYQGGEDWWHYWVDDGLGWNAPGYGVADRLLYDGYADGWIYGRAGQPVPEPAALVMLATGFVLIRRRTNYLQNKCA